MEFLDVIFCDDIRQELNNKLSLMGLYNDRMVLNVNKRNEITWPQPINLATFLRFSLDKEGNKPDSFEFEYLLNKKGIIKINGELNMSVQEHDQRKIQLILNGTLPLAPGDLGFSIKLYSKNKLLLSERNETALVISITQ